MAEKKINMISVILQIAFLVLSFAPMIFEGQYMTASYSPGAYAVKNRFPSNMYEGATNIFAIFIALICLISIVLFVLDIMNKKTGKLISNNKYLPALVAVLYVLLGIYESQVIYVNGELMYQYPLYADHCYGFDLMVGFWIELLIIAGAAFISFPTISNKLMVQMVNQEKKQENASDLEIVNTQVQSMESISDLLLEYKKLFKEGILTQEEFDQKKKELLGL